MNELNDEKRNPIYNKGLQFKPNTTIYSFSVHANSNLVRLKFTAQNIDCLDNIVNWVVPYEKQGFQA